MVDRSIQTEIPAPGRADVKLADVGEFIVQGGDDGLRFIFFQIEGPGIGQNDPLVVKTQVHRVGTQPVTVTGGMAAGFAEQAQGTEGSVVQAELAGEGSFERQPDLALESGTGGQPFKTRGCELPECQLVIRFGPDQFWNKQGKAHGEQAMGWQPKSVP